MDTFRAEVKRLLDGGSTSKPEAPTTNNEEFIWRFLTSKGLNAYAVAGIMGNLYAESALKPTNLQNSYEKSLGYTDDSYTAAVDGGVYTNFVKDCAGYGLAQWTYHTRKQALLDFAKAAGKSIGDLGMQLDFLWKELQGYTSVMSVLKSATSVKQASDAVLTGYEKPADQSDAVKSKRAGYGQGYYDKYATKSPVASETPASAIKKGDTVKLADNATYYDGKAIPAWVKGDQWIVSSVSGDRAVIDKNVSGKNAICSPVNTKFLTVVGTAPVTPPPPPAFQPYMVKVTADVLNIRKGPGTNNAVVGTIRDKGTYTIVEEANGSGATKWGKLKSGLGWVSLDFCRKA